MSSKEILSEQILSKICPALKKKTDRSAFRAILCLENIPSVLQRLANLLQRNSIISKYKKRSPENQVSRLSFEDGKELKISS